MLERVAVMLVLVLMTACENSSVTDAGAGGGGGSAAGGGAAGGGAAGGGSGGGAGGGAGTDAGPVLSSCDGGSLGPLFANEPAGMTRLFDYAMNTLDAGWQAASTNGGTVHIVADACAPSGLGEVVEFVFPQGFTGEGHAPGDLRPLSVFPDGQGTRDFQELYWAFFFYANPEWQNHPSGINKLGYGWINNVTTFGLTWHWGDVDIDGGTVSPLLGLFEGGNYYHFNRPGARNVAPGQWYQLEAYLRLSSSATSNDGVVRLWLNGQLAAEHTTEDLTAGYISDLYFEPTWGGVSSTPKSRTDFMRFGPTRISAR